MTPCKSILIVEDEEAIRETLRNVLELEGYTIFEAAHGQEGLEILPNIPKPCLILVDLMMPVMNGWQFVEVLGQEVVLATIPVVVVTAFPNKAESIRAERVIKKPLDLDLLLETVKSYCG